jgi:hypothetical protein
MSASHSWPFVHVGGRLGHPIFTLYTCEHRDIPMSSRKWATMFISKRKSKQTGGRRGTADRNLVEEGNKTTAKIQGLPILRRLRSAASRAKWQRKGIG